MKETIAVIPTVITKGSWKGMTMAGTRPKNIIRKYSKETLQKPSNNGRKKVQIMSILRKWQKNMREQMKMTNGRLTVRKETPSRPSRGNGFRISPMMSLGMSSSVISSQI
jgi:hypothetical protein